MTSFDKVSRIINDYSTGPEFLGVVHPDRVCAAEQKLGVKFPKSYKQFLERYGCGTFGCEIYGITPSNTGVPSAVWYTLKVRAEGFIPDWLDASTFDENGECKVISWILGLPVEAQPYELTFESFADFLYEECVRPAIEDGWWE